jgi:cytoskeletal protein CcmA (bactofilin family)
VGCFWDEGQVPRGPEELPNPATKIFKTEFIKMVLNDLPEVGGFTLECSPEAVATPLKMVFNSTGIEINAAPAIIKLVTEEGITLEFPPGTISMTGTAITSEIPESTLTLNEGVILINSGDVTVTATADVAIEAATTKITSIVNIEGNTNIIGAVEIEGNTNVTGAIEIEGETNIAGALTVEGETNIVGALTAEGGIAILGAGTIDGALIL